MILPLASRQWLSAGDVEVRYPGIVLVDALAARLPDYTPKGLRLVRKELDRQVNLYAPRWIAWLYRVLPYRFGWHRGAAFDDARPAYFLWSILAPSWHLGWLPARRAKGYSTRRGHPRFGVLRWGTTHRLVL
jgi:hypothetical protein